MDLKQLVKKLQEYAPPDYSGWTIDNLGLLVEPSEPHTVKRVLITNDLTEPVLNESIAKNVQLIIAYHPVIWKGLKRLTQSNWNERKIVKCIENRIAVYCPHTTWDSIETGSNYWLLQPFDTKKIETVVGQEVKSRQDPCGFSKNIKVNLNNDVLKEKFLTRIKTLTETIRLVSEKELCGSEESKKVEIEALASAQGVVDFIDILNSVYSSAAVEISSTIRIYEMDKPFLKNVGLGRIGHLKEPIKIRDVVEKMKKHLNMKTFRLALAVGKTQDDLVETIGVGAGCASGIMNNVKADMLITGEFSHHEILHEVHRGVSVIVTDHTNTERGYSRYFLDKFVARLKETNENVIEFFESEADRDPLEYI